MRKNLILAVFIPILCSSLICGQDSQPVNKNFNPGDPVEAGVDWDDAVIVEGYKDTEFGYGTYLVHYEGKNGAPGYDMRINAKFVRPRSGTADTTNSQAPRINNRNNAQTSLNKEKAGTKIMYTSAGLL